MKRPRIVTPSTQSALIIGALILFLLAALPYTALRQLLDHLARDGSLEAFTPTIHAGLRGAWLILSLLALLAARTTTDWQSVLQRALTPSIWRANLQELFTATRLNQRDALTLAALLLIGLVARLLYLNQPMRYDEAYSAVVFAARPLRYALSDYHLPNNHLLNTLLMHFSLQWFGWHAWSARLPALLTGLLLIPAAYYAGRALYNAQVGLLTATLVTASGTLIEYANNGRGYSLTALFSLLLAALAAWLIRHPNNRAAWLLLGACGALGLYSVPIFLYPFGAIYLFLLLEGARLRQPRTFWAGWLLSGSTAAALTAALYLPVIVTSGIQALTGNNWVRALPLEKFARELPARLLNTWQGWVGDQPALYGWLLAVGVLLSLGVHKTIGRSKTHLLAPAFLWIFGMVTLQRVAPIPKVWTFALSFVYLFGSSGGLGLAARLKGTRIPYFRAVLVPLAVSLCVSPLLTNPNARGIPAGSVAEAQTLTRFLQSELRSGEAVVVHSPVAAPLWFYFKQYNLPEAYLAGTRPLTEFTRVLVIVPQQQNLEEIAEKRSNALEEIDLSGAKIIYQSEYTLIYALNP
ncbi:MAG: hypothetical protein OHK0052_21530 [Anaerolineales bacterium]